MSSRQPGEIYPIVLEPASIKVAYSPWLASSGNVDKPYALAVVEAWRYTTLCFFCVRGVEREDRSGGSG